jgi:hypothetical protein
LSKKKKPNTSAAKSNSSANSLPTGNPNTDAGQSKGQREDSTQQQRSFLQKTKDLFSEPKTWMELAALIVLVIYTQSTRSQVALMKEQFKMDQRPYITIGAVNSVDLETGKEAEPIKGKPIAINLKIVNIGKTVALNVTTHRHMVFGSSVGKIAPEPIAGRTVSHEAIAPNMPTMTTVMSLKDRFANEGLEFNPADVIVWDGSDPIIVFGRSTYSDSFGNAYCTPFMLRHITGNWAVLSGFGDHAVTDLCPDGIGKIF